MVTVYELSTYRISPDTALLTHYISYTLPKPGDPVKTLSPVVVATDEQVEIIENKTGKRLVRQQRARALKIERESTGIPHLEEKIQVPSVKVLS